MGRCEECFGSVSARWRFWVFAVGGVWRGGLVMVCCSTVDDMDANHLALPFLTLLRPSSTPTPTPHSNLENALTDIGWPRKVHYPSVSVEKRKAFERAFRESCAWQLECVFPPVSSFPPFPVRRPLSVSSRLAPIPGKPISPQQEVTKNEC